MTARQLLIESGSHAPGVCAADFNVGPGGGLRIERVADVLRPVLSSYTVFDSDSDLYPNSKNWMLPNWARIWIGLTADLFDVSIGSRRYARVGTASLIGVTSRGMPLTTYGGRSIAIDIAPLAWARLFAPSAESLRDRITPLAELVPAGWSEDLIARVVESERGTDLKFILDAFFLERLPPAHAQEAMLARILALLTDPETNDLSGAAAQVGIDNRLLLRLTKQYFGFPPKILLMRTRFLRALTAMAVDCGKPDFSVAPPGYHDNSHFIRDSNRFLGMTPRRFLALELPYLRTIARAHAGNGSRDIVARQGELSILLRANGGFCDKRTFGDDSANDRGWVASNTSPISTPENKWVQGLRPCLPEALLPKKQLSRSPCRAS